MTAVGAPTPVAPLVAGTKNHRLTIEMGGQSIPLSATTVVAEQNGAWVITRTMKTPQGDATDVVTLDKEALNARSRATKQGPLAIDLAFADGKATGTMSMPGNGSYWSPTGTKRSAQGLEPGSIARSCGRLTCTGKICGTRAPAGCWPTTSTCASSTVLHVGDIALDRPLSARVVIRPRTSVAHRGTP